MRTIRLLLAVALFIPTFTVADDNEFVERMMILGVDNTERYENLEEGCAWAAPFIPVEIVGGAVSDLRAIQARKQTGELLDEGPVVGEMWVCIGDWVEQDDIVFETVPERPLAFYLDIDGTLYGGLGTWRPRTEYGFPEPGMDIWGGSAILVHLVDGEPGATAGAMTYTVVDNVEQIAGYQGGLDSIVLTIRLFEDRNREPEEVLQAFEDVF